jgi:beta-phosphoglucomutase-like phosphatase (HAD superfamily)
MVLRACELLGVEPSEAVVLGDTRFDLEAAKAAAVWAVGVRIDGDDRIERLEELLEPAPARR